MWPPSNHFAHGTFQSSTRSQGLNQWSSRAIPAQNASGSSSACLHKRRYSSSPWMFAWALKSSGHSNTRCSWSVVSIWADMIACLITQVGRPVPLSTIQTSMDRFEEVRRRHRAAEDGGGLARRERQHEEGKLSARERIDLLLDEGTFEETDKLVRHRCRDFGMDSSVVDGDGFVTGYGEVNGRLTFAFAQDFTVFGGSLSEAN